VLGPILAQLEPIVPYLQAMFDNLRRGDIGAAFKDFQLLLQTLLPVLGQVATQLLAWMALAASRHPGATGEWAGPSWSG